MITASRSPFGELPPAPRTFLARLVLSAWSRALAAALALAALPCAAASPAEPVPYTDILRRLTDLDQLTRLQTGARGGLFSSWDRASRTRWGANGDAAQYLRVEPSGEAVMMDIDGPGVIYRVWSANPMGKLRVYLDGAQTPSYEWDFPDLFDGKLHPFIKPLVYRRDKPQSASDCYLPIPFAKHIKITADKAHGQYYHFNYVLLPADQTPASFHLPLSPAEDAALAAAADTWAHPGRDPKPHLPGQQTIVRKITLDPGQTIELCSLKESGMIRAVRARVSATQRYAWRKLVLSGVWDDAPWAQVLTPLGPFFGFDWETAEYGSVPAGCLDGKAYQYYPMPFRKSAKLTLKNYLETSATVEFEIDWAPVAQLPAESVYFYARWRHEPGTTDFDYPFLETAGRGHFVGVAMPIDHPLPGWWGEGDEMVWVDDDDFPPYIGTGSEDYFGDAWGIRYLSGPSYGASSMKGHRTCNYRWHFTDFIPFAKRMRMIIENYGPNGGGPRGQYDYSSTAFWYQAELTPPFEQLRGVKFTGGNDPDAKPGPMEYNPAVFQDITADSLVTYGLGVTFAQQAETLLADALKTGPAKIVTDAHRPYEFDRERAVSFGPVTAGQHLAVFTLDVPAAGVYYPRIHTAQESGVAELTLETGGAPLPIQTRPQRHILQLQGLALAKGSQKVGLLAATAGQAVFDCIELEPAKRFAGAIEAEEAAVLGATAGATAPRPSDPLPGVSAGRLLQFRAERAGQGFIINPGKRPALPYVLGVRPMTGPAAGIIQAFVANSPIGPAFDLFAEKSALGPSILPLGPVPAGANEIEIRVTGQNARSQGFEAALDYFRWEPGILGEGSAEGVWAQVVGASKCEYHGQDLGPAYSGGHQLWIQPCQKNGWVDIAFELPKTAEYEFIARYAKSWDYAVIQTFLDGKPFGPQTDTYAPAVVPAPPLSLGKSSLPAGRHILRFQAAGQNPASKGYLMGIDHVIVR